MWLLFLFGMGAWPPTFCVSRVTYLIKLANGFCLRTNVAFDIGFSEGFFSDNREVALIALILLAFSSIMTFRCKFPMKYTEVCDGERSSLQISRLVPLLKKVEISGKTVLCTTA